MAQRIKRLRELFAYGWGYLRQEGFARTWKRGVGFLRRRMKSKRGRYLPTKQVLAAQRAFCATDAVKDWPKISVLVPLFNTPDNYLKELVESPLISSATLTALAPGITSYGTFSCAHLRMSR